jgi:hypothetical protein
MNVGRLKDKRNAYKILVKGLKGKILGRFRRTCEENIKTYFNEKEYDVVDWINLPRYRNQWQQLVNTIFINPSSFIKGRTGFLG